MKRAFIDSQEDGNFRRLFLASNTAGRCTATRKQYNTLVSVVLCDQLLNVNRSQCQTFALSCILILPLSEGHTLTQSDTPQCHGELFAFSSLAFTTFRGRIARFDRG